MHEQPQNKVLKYYNLLTPRTQGQTTHASNLVLFTSMRNCLMICIHDQTLAILSLRNNKIRGF